MSLKPEILETFRRSRVRCTSQRYAVLEFLTGLRGTPRRKKYFTR